MDRLLAVRSVGSRNVWLLVVN